MCNAVVNSVVLLLMSYGVRLYKLCFEFKVSFSKKCMRSCGCKTEFWVLKMLF